MVLSPVFAFLGIPDYLATPRTMAIRCLSAAVLHERLPRGKEPTPGACGSLGRSWFVLVLGGFSEVLGFSVYGFLRKVCWSK